MQLAQLDSDEWLLSMQDKYISDVLERLGDQAGLKIKWWWMFSGPIGKLDH